MRLLPFIWLLVAAWPPDELREAALLPLLLWPELSCWLAPVRELPCCTGTGLAARVLRLRELDPAGRRIGRDGTGNSDSCRGPEDDCEYSHFFLLEGFLPAKTIRPRTFGFRGGQKFSMNGCLSSRGVPVRQVCSRSVLQEKEHALH